MIPEASLYTWGWGVSRHAIVRISYSCWRRRHHHPTSSSSDNEAEQARPRPPSPKKPKLKYMSIDDIDTTVTSPVNGSAKPMQQVGGKNLSLIMRDMVNQSNTSSTSRGSDSDVSISNEAADTSRLMTPRPVVATATAQDEPEEEVKTPSSTVGSR